MKELKKDYSNNNARTKSAIDAAFLELLQTKQFEKIGVQEICERARVVRSTFYRYYEDKYVLLHALRKEVIESVMDRVCRTKDDLGCIVEAVFSDEKLRSRFMLLSRIEGDGFDFGYHFVEKYCECYYADGQTVKNKNWLSRLSREEKSDLGNLIGTTLCAIVKNNEEHTELMGGGVHFIVLNY